MATEEYEAIMAKLDEILAHVRNLDVLAERRAKNAKQMYNKRHAKDVYTQSDVYTQTTTKEEEGKGEEKSPHTPLKGERREEGEKYIYSRARGCEDSAGQPTAAPETPKDDPETPKDDAKKPSKGEKESKKGEKKPKGDPEMGTNIPPTVEQVDAWLKAKYPKATFTAEHFCAYYESNGWMVGKNKMQNWHGAIVTWMRNSTASAAPAVDMNLLVAQARRKADNWRGTPPEDIEDVL